MIGIENYGAFILAGILLNITPGADTIYILTRSISQGRKAGIISVMGIGTGALIHISFAAFGLSAILVSSALAYNIVRYLGAAYLIYIGIMTLLSKSNSFSIEKKSSKAQTWWKIYRQGILTNTLNPKVALFFLSFLPQFINSDLISGPGPFLILGFTFFTTGSIWCLFLAYSSAFMSKSLRKNKGIALWLQKICGSIFVLLGLQVALRK